MKKQIKFKLPKRIIDLVRLAGHNDNVHESARAAKILWKMLEDKKFEFTLEVDIPDSKPLTWNDVKRSTEPMWKSKPQEPNPYEDIFGDIFDRLHREKRYYDEETKRKQQSQPPPSSGRPFHNPSWGEPGWKSQHSKQKERRVLRCKTCKKEGETTFVGPPEVFECNDCQWTAYQKKKGESTDKSDIPDF